MTPSQSARPALNYVLAAAIIAVTGVILLSMGRTPWCTCGYIKLWHGIVHSSETSQHVADWYSVTHIVHGFLFYAGLWLVGRGWPMSLRLLVAVGLESGWEIIENSDFIIDRYRAATISLDYYGDSVVNSIGDILFMVLGFFAASKLPVWVSAGVVVALEAGLGYLIRDNLMLNVLMLAYPVEAIKHWQAGGGP